MRRSEIMDGVQPVNIDFVQAIVRNPEKIKKEIQTLIRLHFAF